MRQVNALSLPDSYRRSFLRVHLSCQHVLLTIRIQVLLSSGIAVITLRIDDLTAALLTLIVLKPHQRCLLKVEHTFEGEWRYFVWARIDSCWIPRSILSSGSRTRLQGCVVRAGLLHWAMILIGSVNMLGLLLLGLLLLQVVLGITVLGNGNIFGHAIFLQLWLLVHGCQLLAHRLATF